MTDKTIPELYREAADLIDRRGLAQGVNATDGAHCSAAAVNAVAGRALEFGSGDLLTPLAHWVLVHFPAEMREALGSYLRSWTPPDELLVDSERLERIIKGGFRETGALADARLIVQLWNDFGWGRIYKVSGSRTKKQVVATLRECADVLELLDQAKQPEVEKVSVG